MSVWFDKIELRPGDSLIQELGAGIDKSDVVLALVTNNSNKSAWVKKELSISITRELENKRPRVIALLLEDSELPTFLADKIYIRIQEPIANLDEVISALFRQSYVLNIYLSTENLELEDRNLVEDLYEYYRGKFESVHVRIFNNNFNDKIREIVDSEIDGLADLVTQKGMKRERGVLDLQLLLYWTNLSSLLAQLIQSIFIDFGKNMQALEVAIESIEKTIIYTNFVMCHDLIIYYRCC